MKITELKIAPVTRWERASEQNPMRCTVKLESKDTVVETVLSADQMDRVLDLVRNIVAEAAKTNVDAFCALAEQIDHAPVTALPAGGSNE